MTPPDDFTIFRKLESVRTFGRHILGPLAEEGAQVSPSCRVLSETVTFWTRDEGGYTLCRARALGCWCWRGTAMSLTLRVLERLPLAAGVEPDRGGDSIGEVAQNELLSEGKAAPPATAAGAVGRPPELGVNVAIPATAIVEPSPYRFTFDETAESLFPALFAPEAENDWTGSPVLRHGLIVVSGQTGSGKSQIMQRLVQRYLEHFDRQKWGKKGRLPHVITLEDPIEKPLISQEDFERTLGTASDRRFDYTPREIGKDVKAFELGMLDALRQTPAVLVVGETRTPDDWKELLNFAATGHLCITTCHAGSLVETMRKIIEATKATTPDLRSSLVEKIVGVVHLQTFSLPGEWPTEDKLDFGPIKSMTLPAVWRNSHESSNFFVSDGLGAILPRRRLPKGRPTSSCRGRADFADALLADQVTPENNRIKLLAVRSDLKGV